MTDAISILEATNFNWGLYYPTRIESKIGDKFIDNNGSLFTVVPGYCGFCAADDNVCRGFNKPFMCGSNMLRLEQFGG